MTQEDIERWEGYYLEALERGMLRKAYADADKEDAANQLERGGL